MALKNTVRLHKLLKKWSIIDQRFNTALIFLIHYYKFKLIEDGNEKINYEFFNKYDNPDFYKDGVFTMFDQFYEIADHSLESLISKKNLLLIEPISIEIINKLNYFFFTHIERLAHHSKFKLSTKRIRMWLNSLTTVDAYISKIKSKLVKVVRYDEKTLGISIHQNYVRKKVEELGIKLFSLLKDDIEEAADKYLKKIKVKDFSVSDLFNHVNKETESSVALIREMKEKYDILLIESLLHKFVLYLSNNIDSREKETVMSYISQFRTYLMEFQNGDIETQLMFLEHFSIFFTSSSRTKCINSLSLIYNLLITPLNKKEISEIVKGKEYTKEGLRESVIQMVQKHFGTQKTLEETRKRKKGAKKKFFSIINVVLFLAKLKTAVISRSRRNSKRYSIQHSAQEDNVNPYIDEVSLKLLKNLKVKCQLITKKTHQKKYKNYTIERV